MVDVTYEQPLNERIRNLLRLEYLFKWFTSRLSGELEWDVRDALTALIQITEIINRSDLIQQLDNHQQTLTALKKSPVVNHSLLDSTLNNIENILNGLRDSHFQPEKAIKDNLLFTDFKQKITVSAGTCSFDIPRFHHWLSYNPGQRLRDLLESYQKLKVVDDSVKIILSIIRQSVDASHEIAKQGFFQQQTDGKTDYPLLRVTLPKNSIYYPEISAGKHRFTIRFMEQTSNKKKPEQTQADVEFKLHCCVLIHS